MSKIKKVQNRQFPFIKISSSKKIKDNLSKESVQYLVQYKSFTYLGLGFLILVFFSRLTLFIRNFRINRAWKKTKKEFSEHKKKKDEDLRLYAQKTLEISKAFKTLEIGPSSSKSKIEVAYKRKLKEFHPDKYIGSDNKVIEENAKKLEEVHSAYNILIRRQLNI